MAERSAAWIVTTALACACACSSSESAEEPTEVRMEFARAGFFAAPFPSDDLRAEDGSVRLDGFPNPRENPFVAELTRMIAKDARGFATTGGVFFTLTRAIDETSLPDLEGSISAGAAVALVSVDPDAPDFLRRYPVYVSFSADAGPFGAPDLLSIVPLQGVPLLPRHTYAAVITRDVRDARGLPLAPSQEMTQLASGTRPRDLTPEAFERYAAALTTLDAAAEHGGVHASDVAGLAVFTTGDPTAETVAVTRAAAASEVPALEAPPARGEVFDDYCVYDAFVSMPSFQRGTPPFADEGGDWALDAGGRAVVQRHERARVVITVPRAPVPSGGYPLAVMIRTGGGGDRPLVDRGAQDASGAPLAPGSGLARDLARAGFAGASFDGPHGGLRNVTGGDEQFLVFNVDNVTAIRDNVRQTALETVLFERLLERSSFDVSDCPGTGPTPGAARFDVDRLALVGHSMGATIAPLALAAEPRFRGAVLSGAGASWIENLVYKEKPLVVRPIIEILLGYSAEARRLTRGDPVLTLVQWALEPADPLVYAPRLVQAPVPGEAPRQILMVQGIVDHYIMPSIANALSLSLGLDLAGDAIDETSDELRARPDQSPLRAVLHHAGKKQIPLPASGNAAGATAVVRQHPADGIQDGHEVLFQSTAPRDEVRCFLASLGGGAARVPSASTALDCGP